MAGTQHEPKGPSIECPRCGWSMEFMNELTWIQEDDKLVSEVEDLGLKFKITYNRYQGAGTLMFLDGVEADFHAGARTILHRYCDKQISIHMAKGTCERKLAELWEKKQLPPPETLERELRSLINR